MLTDKDAQELFELSNKLEDQTSTVTTGIVKKSVAVANVPGVRIFLYGDEDKHNTPHFHARFNSDEHAVFSIDPFQIMKGTTSALRNCHEKAVRAWAIGLEEVEKGDQQPDQEPRTRLQALRAAWDEIRSGNGTIRIASGENVEESFSGDVSAEFTRIVQAHFSLVGDDMKIDLKRELLKYMAQRGISDVDSVRSVDAFMKKYGEMIDGLSENPI